jgi:hypothetical protein
MTREQVRDATTVVGGVSKFLRDVADGVEEDNLMVPSWDLLRYLADELEDNFGKYLRELMDGDKPRCH